ncbi:MAG: hypothetical protein AB8C84_12620 [Oligoflexales bacterium]
MSNARARLKAQKIELLEELKKHGKSEIFESLLTEYSPSQSPEWLEIAAVSKALDIDVSDFTPKDFEPEAYYIENVLPFLNSEELRDLITAYQDPNVQEFHKVMIAAKNLAHSAVDESDTIEVDQVTEKLEQINVYVSRLQLGSIFAKLEILSNPDTFQKSEESDFNIIQDLEVSQDNLKKHHIAKVRAYMAMTETMPESTLLCALKVMNDSYAYQKEAIYHRGAELLMAAKNTRAFLATANRFKEIADERAETGDSETEH